MLNKLIIIVSGLVLIGLNSWGIELNSDAGAMKFMNEFLQAEFIGDPSFRVDSTINSPKRQQMINEMYQPMIGEIFQWEAEEIGIVDSFEIKEVRVNKQKATATVLFQEFGRTDSSGYVEKPIVATKEIKSEKYQLIYKKGRWWVYDPPLPRISRKALIEYNDAIIKRMSEFVLEKGCDIQKRYYYNRINANKMLGE